MYKIGSKEARAVAKAFERAQGGLTDIRVELMQNHVAFTGILDDGGAIIDANLPCISSDALERVITLDGNNLSTSLSRIDNVLQAENSTLIIEVNDSNLLLVARLPDKTEIVRTEPLLGHESRLDPKRFFKMEKPSKRVIDWHPLRDGLKVIQDRAEEGDLEFKIQDKELQVRTLPLTHQNSVKVRLDEPGDASVVVKSAHALLATSMSDAIPRDALSIHVESETPLRMTYKTEDGLTLRFLLAPVIPA